MSLSDYFYFPFELVCLFFLNRRHSPQPSSDRVAGVKATSAHTPQSSKRSLVRSRLTSRLTFKFARKAFSGGRSRPSHSRFRGRCRRLEFGGTDGRLQASNAAQRRAGGRKPRCQPAAVIANKHMSCIFRIFFSVFYPKCPLSANCSQKTHVEIVRFLLKHHGLRPLRNRVEPPLRL